jgi:hypothetical protein
MADNNLPLLLFTSPTFDERAKPRPRPPDFHRPSIDRQNERLAPKLAALTTAFQERRIALQQIAPGENPELVLVFDIAGSIQEFTNAVAKIPGFEWLIEWDQDELVGDADFYDEDDADKPIQRRLFLVASNQAALNQLITLWNKHQNDPNAKFEHGLGRFKKLFENLVDIRFWSMEDRLGHDIRSYWIDQLEGGSPTISFEIEAWYYTSASKNESARQQVLSRVASLGGHILSHTLIPDIGYHGLLVETPRAAVAAILSGEVPELLLADQIMFFRPRAQSVAEPDGHIEHIPSGEVPLSTLGPPVAALLDGLPQQNHPLLEGRLDIDDPDNWTEGYEAKDRRHGTAMASLILHGDLDAGGQVANRKLYVRPVLRPDPNDFNPQRRESTPKDLLLLDLMHRAIKRICEGEAGQPPAAPTVRIINVSIGNPWRIFDREMSPWARLLDWLSFKYRVLFVVSAGNDTEVLTVSVPQANFDTLQPEERASHALNALIERNPQRRLLSPAESINSLTVGALHTDSSTFTPVSGRFDLFVREGVSPLSRIGHGFRRAIKPDLLMPGGRTLHLQRLGGDPSTTRLGVVNAGVAPGQRAAIPTTIARPGISTGYSRGTSNATALASRAATQAYDVIDALRSQGGAIPPEHDAVLLKALLVHGASWGELGKALITSQPGIPNDKRKDFITRCLGYGVANIDRALGCAAERATLVGTGELLMDEALVFGAPLPPSLSGQKIWRRLTVTLAWLSSINPNHQSYRRAKLSITPPGTLLQVTRVNSASDKATQRGTVQHECLEGNAAVAFIDGARLECKVNCMAAAGKFDHPIPFALCMTLEVAPGVNVPIYNEIRERIAPLVQIQPGAT